MDLFLYMYLIKILSEYHENFIYQQLLNKENKTLHEKNYFHIGYFVISLWRPNVKVICLDVANVACFTGKQDT